MNRRERVLRAFNRQKPDRVPIDFGSFPGSTSINVQAYQSFLDFLGIKKEVRIANITMFTAEVDNEILDRFNIDTKSIKPSIPLVEFNAPEEFNFKPFDVRWRRSTDYTYAPVEGPFQKIANPSVDDLKNFKWPLPCEVEDPVEWKANAAKARAETDRALVGRLPPGIVTLAQYQRGFEGWAMDLVLNQKFSDAHHEKICQIWIETVEGILDGVAGNADILMFGDDLGLQDQPMLNPKVFRKRIKPLMKQMVDSIRKKSKAKIALHSCGSVYEFIEDFSEIGIDALNPLQANAKNMQPEKIIEKAGNRLVFWGGIDTHVVLPTGKPQDVKDEVKRKIEMFGKDGGYILSADHNILVDVPPENLIAMFEAAYEFGKY